MIAEFVLEKDKLPLIVEYLAVLQIIDLFQLFLTNLWN